MKLEIMVQVRVTICQKFNEDKCQGQRRYLRSDIMSKVIFRSARITIVVHAIIVAHGMHRVGPQANVKPLVACATVVACGTRRVGAHAKI